MTQTTLTKTEVLVQLPLSAGTVPLRPFAIGEVKPGMVSHAATPYGTATVGIVPFQSFVFKY